MLSVRALVAIPFRWMRTKAAVVGRCLWAAVEIALWPRQRLGLLKARRAECAAEKHLEQLGHRPRDGP